MKIEEKYKRLTKLSFPVMLSFMAFQLLGFTDILMVGKLGKDAIASVGLALTFFYFLLFPMEGLLDGVTIEIAGSYGKKDITGVKKIFKNSLLLALIMGSIGVIAYFPITFFLSKMAQSSFVYENAKLYFFISSFGIIPQIATGVIMRLFLGVGRAKPIAVFSNLIVVINIVLTYLMVFGKMGFPAWGIAGSAAATLTAKIIGFLLTLFYYLSIRKIILPTAEKTGYSAEVIWRVVKTGTPVAQTNLFEISAWTMFVAVVNSYGTASMAAHEIGMKIKDIAYLPGSAIGVVVTNLAGNFMGESNSQKVREYTYASVKMAVGIMGVFGLIFFIFPEYLVRMFSNDKEVRETAVIVLRIMALYQISDAVFIVFKGVLNGINDTKYVRNMILIGSWFIMVPVSFLLAVALKMGVLGAWLGLTAYVTVIGLFYWKRFNNSFRDGKKCVKIVN